MKIKSWTGDEVEARVGMRVIFKSERGSCEFDVLGITQDELLDANGFGWPADGCTMLHCPFQVGDEVEMYTPSGWELMSAIKTQGDLDACNTLPTRHTNPSLRTSEECKDE